MLDEKIYMYYKYYVMIDLFFIKDYVVYMNNNYICLIFLYSFFFNYEFWFIYFFKINYNINIWFYC